MTNKEKAQGLWGIVDDPSRPTAERQAANLELRDLKRKAKVSWDKLGVDEARLDARCLALDTAGEHDGFEKPLITERHLAVARNGGKAPKPEADPLDEPTPAQDRAAIVEAVKEGRDLPKDAVARGLISAEVRRLLLAGDAPYSEIEAAVRARFPEARTTTRSIASVASDMRRAGQAVSQRRKEAAK